MTAVNTEWKAARANAAAQLAVALEDTLAHIQNVEDALDTGDRIAGQKPDPIVDAGIVYAGLLRSRVTELRAEAAA